MYRAGSPFLLHEFDKQLIDGICESAFPDELVLKFYEAEYYDSCFIVCEFIFRHDFIPPCSLIVPD